MDDSFVRDHFFDCSTPDGKVDREYANLVCKALEEYGYTRYYSTDHALYLFARVRNGKKRITKSSQHPNPGGIAKVKGELHVILVNGKPVIQKGPRYIKGTLQKSYPEDGEEYWVGGILGHPRSFIWTGSSTDLRLLQLGLIRYTASDAQDHMDHILNNRR